MYLKSKYPLEKNKTQLFKSITFVFVRLFSVTSSKYCSHILKPPTHVVSSRTGLLTEKWAFLQTVPFFFPVQLKKKG